MTASESVALPWVAPSASAARRVIGDALVSRGVALSKVHDAQLVVSELVGNALRHAQPPADGQLQVSWRLDDGSLQIEVTDGGSQSIPEVRVSGPQDVGGRGLAMVGLLTTQWGARRADDRCTVWCRVTLPSPDEGLGDHQPMSVGARG